jgi:hypothetical protein
MSKGRSNKCKLSQVLPVVFEEENFKELYNLALDEKCDGLKINLSNITDKSLTTKEEHNDIAGMLTALSSIYTTQSDKNEIVDITKILLRKFHINELSAEYHSDILTGSANYRGLGVFKCLIEHGMDPGCVAQNGNDAFEIAAQQMLPMQNTLSLNKFSAPKGRREPSNKNKAKPNRSGANIKTNHGITDSNKVSLMTDIEMISLMWRSGKVLGFEGDLGIKAAQELAKKLDDGDVDEIKDFIGEKYTYQKALKEAQKTNRLPDCTPVSFDAPSNSIENFSTSQKSIVAKLCNCILGRGWK